MTQKEIDRERKSLPAISVTPFRDWSDEDKKTYDELTARDMINSCLCYGGIEGFWKECSWRYGDKSYAAPYIRKLGRERVEQLVNEQIADFKKAKVLYDVYTDSEGCSYNTIVWADDEVVHNA